MLHLYVGKGLIRMINPIDRKLQNYLIWRLARRYAQELSWDYVHANRKFYDDIYGFKNFWGTWYHCFHHADKSMPDALGSLFAKLHFEDKNKEKVDIIFPALSHLYPSFTS